MTAAKQLLSDYIDKSEVAAELRVCERTLDRWHQLKQGPPRIAMGRRILYRRSSLANWLASREDSAS